MTTHIHPSDKADALRHAIDLVRQHQDYRDPMAPTRLQILQELAREAELEARRP